MNSNSSGTIKRKIFVQQISDNSAQGGQGSFGLLRMFSVYGGRSPGVLTAGKGAGSSEQTPVSRVINKNDQRNL